MLSRNVVRGIDRMRAGPATTHPHGTPPPSHTCAGAKRTRVVTAIPFGPRRGGGGRFAALELIRWLTAWSENGGTLRVRASGVGISWEVIDPRCCPPRG